MACACTTLKALDDTNSIYYAVLPGGGKVEKDQLWAYDLVSKTSRVILSNQPPMPFIVMPHMGLLVGYGEDGADLVIVDVAKGYVRLFGFAQTFITLKAVVFHACWLEISI
jgi:hypothetical protein